MAAIAFASHAKQVTLSTGHSYSYAFIPAKPAHSTILFLHGFPSSCYDWRHQVTFFAGQGYGVLAPDLLGYGETSKPVAVSAYRAKRMATEIREILDHEQLHSVHAVSHDTGSILLSRLANYYPDRLLSTTFLAVPYSKPGEHFESRGIIYYEQRIDEVGNLKSESFFTLFYPADPALWSDHLGPGGALESWLRADTQGAKAPYITDYERNLHQKIMQGQHGPALHWYHALVENVNEQDELDDGLSVKLTRPVLMIFPASLPGDFSVASGQTNEIADDLTVKKVRTSGHWLQLEAKDEVNSMLSEFISRCDGERLG
ncbi:hypothetical protein N7468_006050 [Penicillium chermesinum]|uniref:AB hydrolase-1 domain-containing protein n=1 Tax=Penicillium chermesinum TaxID=63820 RepID=A0A9W9TQ99_9EURO|nr:uncharacterized protein N7468_006050 [Penicillium chermesinum]KAJ5233094.1 hypothetical protein N7468_006050 [Penicillium chermesinum]